MSTEPASFSNAASAGVHDHTPWCGPPARCATAQSALRDRTRWEAGLADRLRLAAEDQTLREIARRTGIHRENVRRYMRDGRPPVRFLAALCEAYGVSIEWLLWGVTPAEGPSRIAG